MKWITTIVFLLSFNLLFSQKDTTVCYGTKQILNISNHIKDLQQRDSVNTLLITAYQTQLTNYQNLHQQDSMILSYRNEEINLLQHKIELQHKLINLQKPKWYETKVVSFTAGMLTVWLTAYMVNSTL